MTLTSVVMFVTVFSMVDIVEGAGTLNGQTLSKEQGSQKSVYAENDIKEWWKADLSAYGDNLILVGYEDAPKIVKEEVAETTVATVTNTEAPVVTQTAITTVQPPAETQPPVVVPSTGEFAFTTYGYGHGVGLSQNGANFYAIYGGYNYQQILAHYYPGITIANTGTAATEQITVDGVTGSVMELLPQVVNYEIGSSMNFEAIKAQAVAAYTYIKYNGNNGRDLKMKGGASQTIIDACAAVLGEACYYNGSYALTMFYASSGGYTASCKDVFAANLPYLTSTVSEYDAAADGHYGTVKIISASTVKEKLESRLGITLSNNPNNWISIVEGDGGYVAYVVIDGQVTIKGNTFRTYLGLKSPKFTYTFS
jgi:peptidoglycan hydrolase-like amidase